MPHNWIKSSAGDRRIMFVDDARDRAQRLALCAERFNDRSILLREVRAASQLLYTHTCCGLYWLVICTTRTSRQVCVFIGGLPK